jgi:2-polyprenyl-3-methyl-5-hydroxy-6-metoxy-1,4-benzoquinol methylase
LQPIDEAAPPLAAAPEHMAHRIVVDPDWGYRRLDPLPTGGELDAFYESQYRDLLDSGGRAPDLARLVAGGPEADVEREWQAATLHADVLAALEGGVVDGAPRRVLDIGCGTGDLLRTLASAGWEAIGTEPAREIADVGRAAGLDVEVATAAEYLARWRRSGAPRFGGIVLLNVLEHVPHPASLLSSLAPALAPGGRLVVRVPNDFNPLQAAALRMLGGEPWWIAVPDHVNYFDHATISTLLERTGFQVLHRSSDFPMELFLLMGDDYRTDPAVGRDVHRRRRRAELALEPDIRRTLGEAWAAAGIGRNALLIAGRPG